MPGTTNLEIDLVSPQHRSMFDFLNRWRRLSRDHPVHEVPDSIIRLLVVTQDDNLYLSVHEAATGCGWETRLARTVERGLQALNEFPASVAIYDWPGTEEDWRFDVDQLTARPDHPCVLLASPVDDEYLCAELVRHGGFDVIPRSADADRFIQNIQFAYFFRRNKVRGGRSFVR